MTRTAPFVSHAAALALAACAVLGFAGCASPSQAGEEPTSVPTAEATPGDTPSATPSATPVAIDPADVTTWTITAAGMGPIQRGAAVDEALAGLPAFTSQEYCPGAVGLRTEGAASLLLIGPEGTITGVWVKGSPDAEGVVPASPVTEAGIELGSTMDELTSAYAELAPSNQTAAESYGYAVGDEANGFINFLVENDVVVMIGVHEGAGVPKEFCG